MKPPKSHIFLYKLFTFSTPWGGGGPFTSLPAWKGCFVFYISWYSIQWDNVTTFWTWNGAIRDFFQILCEQCCHPLTIEICHPWIFLCGRLMYWERNCKRDIKKQMLFLHHWRNIYLSIYSFNWHRTNLWYIIRSILFFLRMFIHNKNGSKCLYNELMKTRPGLVYEQLEWFRFQGVLMYFDKNTNNRTWAQLSFIFRSDWWAGRILIKTIQNSGLCWGFFCVLGRVLRFIKDRRII